MALTEFIEIKKKMISKQRLFCFTCNSRDYPKPRKHYCLVMLLFQKKYVLLLN